MKTFLEFLAIFGLVFLVGLGLATYFNSQYFRDSQSIKTAKAEIEAELSDPASAQYRNIRVSPNGNVCGEVNAKNKFGGYVGFKNFVLIGDSNVHILNQEEFKPFETMCNKSVGRVLY